MPMIPLRDVLLCVHNLLGLMLRILLGHVFLDVLTRHMAKTTQDNVWIIVLIGEHMQITQQHFVWKLAPPIPSLTI